MRKSRLSFAAGFFFGFASLLVAPFGTVQRVEAQPTATTEDYAAAAWPYLSGEERAMADTLARSIFERELSEVQRLRIAGGQPPLFAHLPEWRKMPFRGAALKRLGHEMPDALREAV